MIDDFSRRYRNEIEMLVHWTRGHVDRRKVTKELKRYIEEYGIDINEACKALAMKWADFHEHAYRSPVLDSMEPPPKFALDALEADIFTSLLTRARPTTVAKYMRELGYDEATVKTHMPKFIRKWEEIRSIDWASLMIMKPLDAEEAG